MKKLLILTPFLIILLSSYGVSAEENASQGAETVREKVQEKIEKAKKNPRAYIGTVTDKTNETLQLKNASGEIQLVSIDEENVSFVKTGKSSTNIKFNEVAIGDFVVTMGLENESTVLEASRVLVTSVITPPKRKVVSATVTSISKKELVLKDKNGSELKLFLPKKWKGPDTKNIAENTSVIVVFLEENGVQTLRTIQIISTP